MSMSIPRIRNRPSGAGGFRLSQRRVPEFIDVTVPDQLLEPAGRISINHQCFIVELRIKVGTAVFQHTEDRPEQFVSGGDCRPPVAAADVNRLVTATELTAFGAGRRKRTFINKHRAKMRVAPYFPENSSTRSQTGDRSPTISAWNSELFWGDCLELMSQSNRSRSRLS